MHELSITQEIVDLVQEEAVKAGAEEIRKIDLMIGEMCGFVEESVRFYFDFLSKGTPAEGAELVFHSVTATARCRNCGNIFEVEDMDWVCPACQGYDLEITKGKELLVESIEVE